MECKSCEKPSNNQYANCPPRMADGRMFTDYRPRCIANFSIPGMNEIPGNYDLPNSFEYRQYLIKNASDIMQKNEQTSYALNSCAPCVNPYMEGTMLAEQRIVSCDASTCKFSQKDPNGLGMGRDYGYPSSDAAKTAFLASKQAQQTYQPDNCCRTRADDLGVYGYNYDGVDDMMVRPAVPSGAPPTRNF